MNDRFNFRFWYFNEVEKKWKLWFCDLMSVDGTCLPFDNGEGGAYTDWEHEFICEQCTGLKDKNGKLIYENDIIRIVDQCIEYIVSVYWESEMYCFSISPNSANLVFSDLSDNETSCEVIGNIHENADFVRRR